VAATDRKFRSIRGALSAACALAGVGGVATSHATEVETAILGYTEPNRVSALETVLQARHDFGSGRLANFRVVYDALTGASASGAVPGAAVQTFTRPSGRGSYDIAPGETPLDDTFRDARVAVSGGLTLPLGRMSTISAGLYGSGEHDYTSLGANASFTRDFDRRNRTLSAGLSYSQDTVTPEGGRPIPFASMAAVGADQPRLAGDGSKDVADAMLGLVQVIDRATLAQFTYSLSRVTGYQTDPYKLVSVVDPTSGGPVDQLFEHRPDARTKHILFGRVKRQLSHGAVDLSYRFMTDDWGIASHTVELRDRVALGGGGKYLQPHLRFYSQSAADFYARWLLDGAVVAVAAELAFDAQDFGGGELGEAQGLRLVAALEQDLAGAGHRREDAGEEVAASLHDDGHFRNAHVRTRTSSPPGRSRRPRPGTGRSPPDRRARRPGARRRPAGSTPRAR
jgi:Protein of unknown function (DUF3570)